MKKLLTFAATAVAATFMSANAHAVVLDFVAEAAGNERGIVSGTTIANFQGTGVDVTFTAGSGDWFPYFDDLSGTRPGGLGVCKSLDDDDQCVPGNDDNVSEREYVELSFGGADFSIHALSFNDRDHLTLGVPGNDGKVAISLDGGLAMTMLFSEAIAKAKAGTFAAASSIRFAFVDRQFYVASISDVPIPGAIPLLLSGLAGLGFASRRRKAA